MNLIGLYTFIRQEVDRMQRVWQQTLFTPWISALLYILVFGEIIGSRIGKIAGVPYIDFVVPGLVMMNIMQSSFAQTSSSLYFQRFLRNIEEVLTAPLAYHEIVIGYLIAGVIRGIVVGAGVYVIALFFTIATPSHLLLFLFYALSVSLIFSLAGILVALWAEGFEQLAIPSTYIIMPLSFVGGLFNSIAMLPDRFQMVAKLNPFFYFVDGLRYSMIGVTEASHAAGYLLILALIAGLGVWTWSLFRSGYKIRK